MTAPLRSVPNLVVLLAPPGPLAGVRDALQDWSALGLIDPFLWIEREHKASSGRTPGIYIDAGEVTAVTLEQILAQTQRRIIRLCVLVPALRGIKPVSEELEDHVATLASEASGSAPVKRIRCTITRPRSGPGQGDPARPGWHNLVISPEDRQGPSRGAVPLDPSLDAIDIGPHAAAVICGVTGLWSRIADGPLDTAEPFPGRTIRVVRSFYRRLDAAEVERRVRDGVVSMVDGLPRPREGASRSVYVENTGEATARMARAFWARHAHVLGSGVLQADAPEVQPLSAGQAIRMFFTFLWATIVNGPERWYQSVVLNISAGVAGSLQSGLFGRGDAEYAVVVRGVRADGTLASWRDMASASDQLGKLLSDQSIDQHPLQGRTPMPTVWRDLVGAALTLADAGIHVPGIDPLKGSNIDRAVLRRPADIAPGSDAAFGEPPSGAARGSVDPQLRPTDVLAVDITRRRLKAASEQPDSDPTVDRTMDALARWTNRYRETFTVQVGAQLGTAVMKNARDVRDLLERLRGMTQAPEFSSDLMRRQRRLATIMWVLFGVLIVALAVLIVLGVRETIDTSTAVLSCVGAVLIWFGATALVFALRQRNLFAELNRRKQAAAQAEIDRQNLAVRLQDLRRTTQAYAEFLEWSRVIAVMVTRPFGDQPPGVVEPPVIGAGMPSSTSVGVARPSDAIIEEAVASLREGRYRFGWLDTLWEELVADAAGRLGPRARDLRGDPARIYSEASGPDYLLTQWADLLESEGAGSAAADALWADALRSLRMDETLGDALVSDVTTSGDGSLRLPEFMAEIGELVASSAQRFDHEVFAPQARVAGKASVTDTWPRHEAPAGLGRGAVTVQLSDGLAAWDLSWLPEQNGPSDEDEESEDPDKDIET